MGSFLGYLELGLTFELKLSFYMSWALLGFAFFGFCEPDFTIGLWAHF